MKPSVINQGLPNLLNQDFGGITEHHGLSVNAKPISITIEVEHRRGVYYTEQTKKTTGAYS